jgi:hypothetical protein
MVWNKFALEYIKHFQLFVSDEIQTRKDKNLWREMDVTRMRWQEYESIYTLMMLGAAMISAGRLRCTLLESRACIVADCR